MNGFEMKDYTLGLLTCRCSNAMRIGKLVKMYQFTVHRKKCPNCGKKRNIRCGDDTIKYNQRSSMQYDSRFETRTKVE